MPTPLVPVAPRPSTAITTPRHTRAAHTPRSSRARRRLQEIPQRAADPTTPRTARAVSNIQPRHRNARTESTTTATATAVAIVPAFHTHTHTHTPDRPRPVPTVVRPRHLAPQTRPLARRTGRRSPCARSYGQSGTAGSAAPRPDTVGVDTAARTARPEQLR